MDITQTQRSTTKIIEIVKRVKPVGFSKYRQIIIAYYVCSLLYIEGNGMKALAESSLYS